MATRIRFNFDKRNNEKPPDPQLPKSQIHQTNLTLALSEASWACCRVVFRHNHSYNSGNRNGPNYVGRRAQQWNIRCAIWASRGEDNH